MLCREVHLFITIIEVPRLKSSISTQHRLTPSPQVMSLTLRKVVSARARGGVVVTNRFITHTASQKLVEERRTASEALGLKGAGARKRGKDVVVVGGNIDVGETGGLQPTGDKGAIDPDRQSEEQNVQTGPVSASQVEAASTPPVSPSSAEKETAQQLEIQNVQLEHDHEDHLHHHVDPGLDLGEKFRVALMVTALSRWHVFNRGHIVFSRFAEPNALYLVVAGHLGFVARATSAGGISNSSLTRHLNGLNKRVDEIRRREQAQSSHLTRSTSSDVNRNSSHSSKALSSPFAFFDLSAKGTNLREGRGAEDEEPFSRRGRKEVLPGEVSGRDMFEGTGERADANHIWKSSKMSFRKSCAVMLNTYTTLMMRIGVCLRHILGKCV